MSNTREHKGRFGRLLNRPKPLQLFNFLKARVLRLRHRHRKPASDGLVTPPTLVQDAVEDSSLAAKDIQRIFNKNSTFLYNYEMKNEHQGGHLVSKPAASHQDSGKNHLKLINLIGIKTTSIRGCIDVSSPKDGPFLEFELVFGVDFPRDNIHCYRARAPAQTGRCPDKEFRRDPAQKAGKLWSPDEEPLKRREEPEPLRLFACPYLMYDPTTYAGRKFCRGAAFSEIHRLKEHLHRQHKQKPHCAKCGEPFVDESGREYHGACSSRFLHPLTGKFLQDFEGFNEEQEAKLKDKKRKRCESNEGKWRDIFKILFPDATEIPSPYYKPPGSVEWCDTKYGFVNNLFENSDPTSERIARLRIEKTTGSLSEEAWGTIKDTMREHFLTTATTLRKPANDITNRRYPESARSRDSDIADCSSSTCSTSNKVPDAKRVTGPRNGENLDHEDIQPLVPMGDHLFEAQDNGREPDIEDLSPGKNIDAWLSGIGGMFEWSNRPSQPSQPKPSSPSTPSPPSPSSVDEATSRPKLSLPIKRAPEDGLHPNQEATAEVCEEQVFNNLNLTPEECLVAALEQKTPKWQGPEADYSPD